MQITSPNATLMHSDLMQWQDKRQTPGHPRAAVAHPSEKQIVL